MKVTNGSEQDWVWIKLIFLLDRWNRYWGMSENDVRKCEQFIEDTIMMDYFKFERRGSWK